MRYAIGIVFLFAAATLSGCLTGGTVQNVEAPNWSSGYAWSWNTTGEAREVFYMKVGDEKPEQREEQGPLPPLSETVEVLNTTLNLHEEPVYLTGYWNNRMQGASPECYNPGGDYPGVPEVCDAGEPAAMLTTFRKSDLSELPLSYQTHFECHNSACKTKISNLRVMDTPDYPLLDFPLDSGKSWGGPLDRENSEDPRLDWEYQARVTGTRSVSTAVGSMDSVRVEVVVRPANLAEYKEAILDDAEEEGVQVDSFDYRTSIRTVIYYSEEAQMIVRADSERVEEIQARFVEDGEAHEIRAHESRTTSTVLTGVQLYERPERNLDYAARLVFGEIPIADPAGVLPDPRRVTVSIRPDVPNLNVFDETDARFHANITDSEDNSSQLDVKWTVFDYERDVVADGEGTTFTASFELPGMYGVQAEIVDPASGAVLAAKEVPFEVYLDGTYTLNRLVDVLFFDTGDSELELPVLPGIQRLEVSADAGGLGFVQTLRVFDAEGNSVGTDTGSQAEVQVVDFSDYFVSDEPWRVEWDSTVVGALEFVELHIVERYTGDPLADAEEPDDGSASGGIMDVVGESAAGSTDASRFW